jgi:uncharacterized protein YjbJ (UPF0337 family)
MMRKDTMQDALDQLKAAVKQRWGALTDRDLDTLDEKLQSLPGLLKTRYGYTEEQAEKEIALLRSSMNPDEKNPFETVRETISSTTPEEEAHVATKIYK